MKAFRRRLASGALALTVLQFALHAGALLTATARPSLPDAPPPRLL